MKETHIHQLRLLSITQAAKVLSVGRDTLKKLLAEGKIGFIPFGKRKKIPMVEIMRFQVDNVICKKIENSCYRQNKDDISKILGIKSSEGIQSLNGGQILNKIMRR